MTHVWATEVKAIHLDFVHCPTSVLHKNQDVLEVESISNLLCLAPILHLKHVRVLHHQILMHVITQQLLDYILT